MPLSDLLSATGALALVLGLILLVRFGSRFLGRKSWDDPSKPLRLTAQLGLDGRRRLYLVQAGEGQVLLLTGGATDMMIEWPARPVARP